MKRALILSIIILTLIFPLASAATLKGSVYSANLDLESNVLLEINTEPQQKFLAKDGNYQFDLLPGTYTLTATKDSTTITEEVTITKDGTFLYDLFLLPDFTDDAETDEDLLEEPTTSQNQTWRYWVAGIIILLLLWRFLNMRRKFGPLRKFRQHHKEEQKKTIEQHKEDINNEPGYVEKTIDIIKKHDGRISQKALRKELLHLSEAKVSLILTELEHKGKIEKVKKGRGNVILLK